MKLKKILATILITLTAAITLGDNVLASGVGYGASCSTVIDSECKYSTQPQLLTYGTNTQNYVTWGDCAEEYLFGEIYASCGTAVVGNPPAE
jgi:hypothetical protein